MPLKLFIYQSNQLEQISEVPCEAKVQAFELERQSIGLTSMYSGSVALLVLTVGETSMSERVIYQSMILQ